jgi:tetratricopeptide (TPR) repeat protein
LVAAKADLNKSLELGMQDTNGPWWIELDWIINTADTEFQTWMLDYLDRLVKASDRDPVYLGIRCQLALHLGKFEKARIDLVDLKESADEKTRYRFWYYDALLAAYSGDMEHYQRSCEEMLDEFGDSGNFRANYFTAWTFALMPDAAEDYEGLIQLAEQSLQQTPEDPQFRNGLGAIHFRAGNHEQALKHLSAALEQSKTSTTSPAYAHYLLAMTQHGLGDQQASTTALQRANEIAESELSDSPTWNRKLTLKLLRREAESLLARQSGDSRLNVSE